MVQRCHNPNTVCARYGAKGLIVDPRGARSHHEIERGHGTPTPHELLLAGHATNANRATPCATADGSDIFEQKPQPQPVQLGALEWNGEP